jgi:hypothetical protein
MRLSAACIGALCAALAFDEAQAADAPRQPSLDEIYATLATKRFVDLNVKAWESRHGRVPEHAFVGVGLRTATTWPNEG